MSAKQTGLGRGLDSLIPKDFDSTILADESEKIQKIEVSQILPNTKQPRKHFDEQALTELSESIKQHGLLQPIIVSPTGGGKYQIIAGERRWRASKLAGIKTISAIARTSKELEQLEVALVENVQRVDLSPLEQAASIEKLHEQFNLDYPAIGKKLGKAGTTITNIARLLKLPKEAREALSENRITEGHARAILAIKESNIQQVLLGHIIKKRWTVRQAENFVTAHKQGGFAGENVTDRLNNITDETKAISKKLGTKVALRRMAKGGKIEITYKSDKDLRRITNMIVGS